MLKHVWISKPQINKGRLANFSQDLLKFIASLYGRNLLMGVAMQASVSKIHIVL